MEVAVIINGQAGYANRSILEAAVRSALFRCHLRFHNPQTREELQSVIVEEAKRVDVLVVCGGDGTLNTAIQPLLRAREHLDRIPPICMLPVGTANDLARELGISGKIEKAARLVLEGKVKTIDVLEIEAEGRKAYMLTNGGLGIPAVTADLVNQMRSWIIKTADCEDTKAHWRPVLQLGKSLIKRAGARIYEITLAGQLTSWDANQWQVELEIEGYESFATRAPFIMVNNQRTLGANYMPAPLTSNADGTFNIMLLQSLNLIEQTRNLLQIRAGRIPDVDVCPRYETKSCTIRQLPGSRALTFFGDGEILHREVPEIKIRCLHNELPVIVKGEEV